MEQANTSDAGNGENAVIQRAAHERTVLARVEYLTDVMGDILNHVGGDPDTLRGRMEGRSGGSHGGPDSVDGGASDQAPSKAED